MEFFCESVKFRILCIGKSFYPQFRVSLSRWGFFIERDTEIMCESLYEAMQYIEFE